MGRKTTGVGPGDWMSRLDQVRETGDRRASLPLLCRFLDPSTGDERRGEIAAALAALEDLRLAGPLRDVVLDVERPAELRSLALLVHSTIPVDAPSRREALGRCRSADAVTRAFGVRTLDVEDGETLAAAASDPAPLVRHAALDAIASIARTRPLVEAAVRAFGDEDAAIREAACRVALFDEPLDATHELVRALGDPSTAVRAAACDALEDYPRVCVLLALADARAVPDAGVPVLTALEGVVARVRAALAESSDRARRRVERWAGPVRWLLGEPSSDLACACEIEDDAAAPDPVDADASRHDPVDVDEAADVLADDDAPPAAQRRLLVFRSWTAAGAAGLEVVRECAKSPNWSLRQGAAFAFADLAAADDLVALAADREPVVRRAAFESLRRLEEPRGVAPARETLADPVQRPTAGDDALALVVRLSRPADAERAVLDELARPDDRDGMWLGAVHTARHLELLSAVPHLRRIAESPIVSSVLPHVAALAALRELGKTRARIDLRHLESLDHLEVQRELGEWGWRGGRYG